MGAGDTTNATFNASSRSQRVTPIKVVPDGSARACDLAVLYQIHVGLIVAEVYKDRSR